MAMELARRGLPLPGARHEGHGPAPEVPRGAAHARALGDAGHERRATLLAAEQEGGQPTATLGRERCAIHRSIGVEICRYIYLYTIV